MLTFQDPVKKPFQNTVGKVEYTGKQHYPPLSQCFQPCQRKIALFSQTAATAIYAGNASIPCSIYIVVILVDFQLLTATYF